MITINYIYNNDLIYKMKLPESWKQRREKRKKDWKNIGKDFKKAKEELKIIPHKVREDLDNKIESKKNKFNSKNDYISHEITELNNEHKKIQKSQIWWLIGAICGLVFPPITIGVIIVMIINVRKMSKIREQIKEKQREVDLSSINN